MHFRQRVADHLRFLYPDEPVVSLAERVLSSFGLEGPDSPDANLATDLWSEHDAVLITYADTLVDDGVPLRTLSRWVDEYPGDVVSTVHVLPYFPWSSDDGFSVIDPSAVDPTLGTWEDVSALAKDVGVMSDLVLNHVSVESEWFKQFERNEPPGNGFFISVDPQTDLSGITRPRTHPLLRPTETSDGIRHVWATFSHDQVDLNLAHPEVLLALLDVVRLQLDHGVKMLRLDAVAYLWKRLGTPCIHLPETHEVIRLMRTLVDERARRRGERPALLVTETNVPTDENLSYFGGSDEAHVVYNFSLPPLLLHACLTGDTGPLTLWAASMPDPPKDCTYLNFFASHDGIGVRPAEGLLDSEQIGALVVAAEAVGGGHRDYQTADGPRPYELNASLRDLLALTEDAVADDRPADRLLAAHAVVLSLAGIPAIYIHSLLGTQNDHDRVKRLGHLRAINRAQLPLDDLYRRLAGAGSFEHQAFDGMSHMLRVRGQIRAFSPEAGQQVLELPTGLFGVRRFSSETEGSPSEVISIVNLADHELMASAEECGLVGHWGDVLSSAYVGPVERHGGETMIFQPYARHWFVKTGPSEA
jgi:sucrose phosphorylase